MLYGGCLSFQAKTTSRLFYWPSIKIMPQISGLKSSMSSERAVCPFSQLTISRRQEVVGRISTSTPLKGNAGDYLLPERFRVNQLGRQQYDVISAPPDLQPSEKLEVRFSAFCCARRLGLPAQCSNIPSCVRTSCAADPNTQLPVTHPQMTSFEYPLRRILEAV